MIGNVKQGMTAWEVWGLPVVSGVLLGLAFPPFEHTSGLAWVALVPLLLFLRRASVRAAVFGGLVFSSVFNLISMAWMTVYGWPAYLGLSILLAGSVAIPYFLWLKVLCGSEPRRYLVWAPTTWVVYEYAHTLGYWAFPWGNIAHTQWGLLPVVQTAAWTGVYGVAFLIVFVNAGVFVWLDAARKGGARREWPVAALPIALVLVAAGMGAARLRATFPGEALTVGVAQGKEKTEAAWDWQKSRQVLDEYELLLTPLKNQGIDLMVLPESFAELYDYPKPDVPGCAQADLGLALAHWMKDASFMLAYGAEGVDHVCEGKEQRGYNSFFLRDGKGIRGRVDKRRLVPFGEYVPMRPFITRIFPQYPWGGVDLDSGSGTGLLPFRLPGCDGKECERPVGALICFETLFPQDSRDLGRKGARLLVSGTNSSWFRPWATEQMIRFEAFRPVETGLYLARAGTGGISTIIDPAGRFLVRLQPFVAAEGHAKVTLREADTFYARHGDWFVWLAAALALGITTLKWAPHPDSG